MIQRSASLYSEKALQDFVIDSIRIHILSLSDDIFRPKEVDPADLTGRALLQIFTLNVSEESILPVMEHLKDQYPWLQTLVMSEFGNQDFTRESTPASPTLVASYIGMKDSCIHILCEDAEEVPVKTIANRLSKRLGQIPDLKGVETIGAGTRFPVDQTLHDIERHFHPIPFFGTQAQTSYLGEHVAIPYVITDGVIRHSALTLVAFSGKNLYIDADVLIGWKPIGKSFTVETEPIKKDGRVEGVTYGAGSDDPGEVRIKTIDGSPAIDVYNKYLGLSREQCTVENTCEFPFIITRDGKHLGRVPFAFGKDGSICFDGLLLDSDVLQLSYGKKKEILKMSADDARQLEGFSPEAAFLYVCANLTVFLNDKAYEQIKYYMADAPYLQYVHGNCEIYECEGKGGIYNTSLVRVFMREGEKRMSATCTEINPAADSSDSDAPHHSSVPLQERLVNFLEAMTGDLLHLNEAYKDMAEKADAANRSKSSFLSNVSHEIRTPMNAILGMNEMIQRECTDKNIIGYSNDIASAGNTLLGIINDILDFSKIEAGKLKLMPVEYDLTNLLNDLVNMIRKRAEDKGLTLNLDIDTTIPRYLYGDEIRVKQVITNILTNAVKYTPDGSVTLTLRLIKKADGIAQIHVSVKDTGIGIKQEDLPRLFEAFERIDEAKNRTIEGTGLGMNITSMLLNMMGSEIHVESFYGKGSEFYFDLDQKVIRDTPIGDIGQALSDARTHHEEYHESFTAPDAKVLAVDDTVMNLAVFKDLLKDTKVQIDTAESGEKALKMVQETKYDLIFMDHRMPHMDGVECLDAMKKLPPSRNLSLQAPVVALTANAVSGMREYYLKAGFDAYLTKPINSSELESLMIRLLPVSKVHRTSIRKSKKKKKPALPDWLTSIKEIDTDTGLTNCGDAEGYLYVINVFIESIDLNYGQIESFFNEEDWKNYTIKVHALKSSARIIGAIQLSDEAKELEALGNDWNIDAIREKNPILLAHYRKLGDELKAGATPAASDDDKPEISDAELTDALSSMAEVAKTYDYDSMKFMMDSLLAYRLPLDVKLLTDELKTAMITPDWEKINELLSKEAKK